MSKDDLGMFWFIVAAVIALVWAIPYFGIKPLF